MIELLKAIGFTADFGGLMALSKVVSTALVIHILMAYCISIAPFLKVYVQSTLYFIELLFMDILLVSVLCLLAVFCLVVPIIS